MFGSSLHRDDPKDIDILVVYDPLLCPPAKAYQRHRFLRERVEQTYGRSVHLTLLTKSEEARVRLVEQTRAVSMSEALTRLSRGLCEQNVYDQPLALRGLPPTPEYPPRRR